MVMGRPRRRADGSGGGPALNDGATVGETAAGVALDGAPAACSPSSASAARPADTRMPAPPVSGPVRLGGLDEAVAAGGATGGAAARSDCPGAIAAAPAITASEAAAVLVGAPPAPHGPLPPDGIDDGKGGGTARQRRDGLLRWLYQGPARARTGLQGFQVTIAHPCPYLPTQLERKVWTLLDDAQNPDYAGLARGGFRRSHMIAYRPACPTCSACVPVRIPVARLRWSKSFRRAWRANADLAAVNRPAIATGEQFRLFQRYLTARHHDGEMAGMTALDYRCMIEDSPLSSQVVEWRRPGEVAPALPPADRDRPTHLTAACLIDRMEDGLSAVYSFFEPGMPQRSLGSHIVLWLVEQARAEGLPYVYLGYWIAASRKMAYKARFQPLEGLIDGRWRTIEPTADIAASTMHPCSL